MLLIEILLIQITISSVLINFLLQKLFVQNDFLTKETVKTNGIKSVSAISGIISTCLMIFNFMSFDSTVITAGLVALVAKNWLNRTNSLFSHGNVGDDKDKDKDKDKKDQKNKESRFTIQLKRKDKNSQGWTP